ncbi:UDP-glucose 4-epimerase GalE [Stappia sp. ES.058]|uniref:UDP-glucose 4-epimerase GalE n=1 Tax=Stappia sp. ES.058 TaxID=1881061 RepID=UPI0008797B3F|nr:UDP-glucose 4-epimerase GalE [Stappia sp. ES.058]SDU02309.1 UDP-galactose 4-epimerase [Stappia sp. ES.058]
MATLVTGGAGYIGSHMVWRLLDAGETVVVIDDLSTGHDWAVPGQAHFIQGNARDQHVLEKACTVADIDAVIHFAGSAIVPESITDPLKYYGNNTCASRDLIENCLARDIRRILFSSTAAVYGDPGDHPVSETARTKPLAPYGASKLMVEAILHDTARATGLRYGALRYFNVAGADPQGRAGQSTAGATHLLKVACEAALGIRDGITVYGTDYPTRDGTAERDFVHVSDLVEAHFLALRHLRDGGESFTANCGYGQAFSVLEVIDAVKEAAGVDFPLRFGERRDGDSARVVADNRKIHSLFDWQPAHHDLPTIARHAVDWERKLRARNAPASGTDGSAPIATKTR